jgi:hypothetical protein
VLSDPISLKCYFRELLLRLFCKDNAGKGQNTEIPQRQIHCNVWVFIWNMLKLDNLTRLHQGLQPADNGSVNLLEMSDCVCAGKDGLWSSESTTPLILYFGTRRRCVVSFTSQPLYLREICCVRLIFNCIKMHFLIWHSTKIIAYLTSCYGHSEFPINYRYFKLLVLTDSCRWFYYGAMSNTLCLQHFILLYFCPLQ